MSGVKKQVLSNAIDILLNQGNLPEKLDGKKLYGESLEGDYAYWLASGISTEYDEKMVDDCIQLFCEENLSQQ